MPDIKLRCTACRKRYLAAADTYGSRLLCRSCRATLDGLAFTTPDRNRMIPRLVESKEPSLLPDGLLYPLLLLEPGVFRAGRLGEGGGADRPAHEVKLTNPAWMGSHLITQLEYRHVMRWNPSGFPDLNHPVNAVTWFEAQEFCRRLTERLRTMRFLDNKLHLRLPTEAEWEYACRTPPKVSKESEDGEAKDSDSPPARLPVYSWGDDPLLLADHAWYVANSGAAVHPVGGKAPAPRGFHDMHGNVSEWCLDWFAPYPKSSCVNPRGPDSGTRKARRGGSWASVENRCRGTDRMGVSPHCRSALIGFRVVLSAA